jgi:hypothetical protein
VVGTRISKISIKINCVEVLCDRRDVVYGSDRIKGFPYKNRIVFETTQ